LGQNRPAENWILHDLLSTGNASYSFSHNSRLLACSTTLSISERLRGLPSYTWANGK